MYSTAFISLLLLYFRFRILEYSGSISSHCASVKSVWYSLCSALTSFMLLLYHIPLMKTSSKFYCLTSREPFRCLFCMLHLLCYAVMVIFRHPLLHFFNFTIYLTNLFIDCLYQRTVNYLCYSIAGFFYIMI